MTPETPVIGEIGKRSESFPKTLRLRRRSEFLRVQEKGQRVVAEPLLALALRNGREVTRLGITVSSKVGNAVLRVRLRRLLREIFRKNKDALPSGVDLVLIARTSAKDADHAALKTAYDAIAVRLKRMFP
jgi:ribonuclease P protein component